MSNQQCSRGELGSNLAHSLKKRPMSSSRTLQLSYLYQSMKKTTNLIFDGMAPLKLNFRMHYLNL